MVKAPVVNINGEEIKPKEPTVKLWREILKFDEQAPNKSDIEGLDWAEKIICQAFDNPKVTQESLDENVKASELLPLFWAIKTWVMALVFGKAEELPNVQTPTARE